MNSFQSHLLRGLALTMALTSVTSVGCVNDLDFDEIAPQCEAPLFDAPSRDAFCSGQHSTAGRVEAPEDKRFIGADLQGDLALAVSASELVASGDLTIFNEVSFHAVSVDELSLSGEALDPGAVQTLDADTGVIPLSTPVGGRWLDLQGRLAAALFPNLFVPKQLEGGAEALDIVPSEARLPFEKVDDKPLPQFFIDMAAFRSGDDLTVFLAAGIFGVKPLLYTFDDDTGRWSEKLADVNEIDDTNHACLNRCCRSFEVPEHLDAYCAELRRDGELLSACGQELLPHCLTYPTGFGAYSLDVDAETGRLYVGSQGAIHVYDATLLSVENIENLSVESGQLKPISATFSIPPITAESLGRPVPEELPLNGATVADVKVHDGWLYAVLVNAAVVTLNSPSQPYLLQMRLDNGLPTDEVIITELPVFRSQTLFVNLLPLGDDLMVYQTLESEQKETNGSQFISQEDSGVFVLDLVRREAPRVLLQEVIDHQNVSGVGTIGGEKGASRMLLTTPDGAELRTLSVSGEPL